jgi:uncharacterized RDD family membrane protein YckC
VTAPAARIPREARPFQGRRAGLATRVLAGAIDALVLLGLFAGGYAVWAAAIFLWSPRGFSFPAPSRSVVVVVGYLVCIAYLAFCWRVSGRTYGDQMIGLRVVGRADRSVGIAVALVRAAFCAVFPFGLLWTAVSRENRSLADLLLRTSVVYDWQPGPISIEGPDGAVGTPEPSRPVRPAPPVHPPRMTHLDAGAE